jgi:hypothetical protein
MPDNKKIMFEIEKLESEPFPECHSNEEYDRMVDNSWWKLRDELIAMLTPIVSG